MVVNSPLIKAYSISLGGKGGIGIVPLRNSHFVGISSWDIKFCGPGTASCGLKDVVTVSCLCRTWLGVIKIYNSICFQRLECNLMFKSYYTYAGIYIYIHINISMQMYRERERDTHKRMGDLGCIGNAQLV